MFDWDVNVVFNVEADCGDRARADVCAPPPAASAPEHFIDLEFGMLHGEIVTGSRARWVRAAAGTSRGDKIQKEFEQRLIDRWPMWFSVTGSVRKTSMSLGFTLGDGWFDLLWRLCERLEPVVPAAQAEMDGPFQVLQVKEKFGELRFYPNYSDDAIAALIEAARLESTRTCEVCGEPGERRGTGWIVTRCDEHVEQGRWGLVSGIGKISRTRRPGR